MSDCWDMLGIAATSDIVAIRNAYRELVKRYHPDTVLTPEEKLRYTDFCAGINQAYREAIEWAKHHSADSSRVAAAPSECFEAEGGLLWKAAGKLDSPFARRLIIGFLVLVLAGFAVLPYAGASLTRSLSETVRVSVGLIAGLSVLIFVVVIIALYGIAVGGILDLILVLVIPRKMIVKLGWERYENQALWILIVAANFTLFFGTNMVAIPSSPSERMSWLYDGVVRGLAAATVPVILGSMWLRRVVVTRRGRRHFGSRGRLA
jgi:hypothetical protein